MGEKKKKKKKSLAPLVPGRLKGAVTLIHLDSREQLCRKEDSAAGTELIQLLYSPLQPFWGRGHAGGAGTAAQLSAGPKCSGQLNSYRRNPDDILIYARSCAGRFPSCAPDFAPAVDSPDKRFRSLNVLSLGKIIHYSHSANGQNVTVSIHTVSDPNCLVWVCLSRGWSASFSVKIKYEL